MKNKILAIYIISISLLMLDSAKIPALSEGSEGGAFYLCTSNPSSVNIRSGPGKKYRVIFSVPTKKYFNFNKKKRRYTSINRLNVPDDYVKWYGSVKVGGERWDKIGFGGRTGYVKDEYICSDPFAE
jgi:hypothetical protein